MESDNILPLFSYYLSFLSFAYFNLMKFYILEVQDFDAFSFIFYNSPKMIEDTN